MNNSPCKDCIVLAMCRSKLMDRTKQYTMTAFSAMNFLKKDCSLLHEHLNRPGDVISRTNDINDAIACLLCP